jgi:hypothetical protein
MFVPTGPGSTRGAEDASVFNSAVGRLTVSGKVTPCIPGPESRASPSRDAAELNPRRRGASHMCWGPIVGSVYPEFNKEALHSKSCHVSHSFLKQPTDN